VNAPASFTPTAESDLLSLAWSVLAGDYSGLPRITESERYNLDQWHKEAQATVDGDGRDFARMIAREGAHQLFHADIRAGYRDEFDSFDDFVALSPMRVTAGMAA